MLLYLSCIVLSVTLLFCIVNFIQDCYTDVCKNFLLKRCVFSIVVSLLVASWGIRRKSLDRTGATAGIIVGFIQTYCSYCFLACLFTFFYTSSKATHFRSEKKKKLEAEFKEGGQRNWIQVLCNGGASTEMAMLFFLLGGPGEGPIDFNANFLRSWLAAAVLAAFAGTNGDTWASEIGTVMSKQEPMLITSLKKVPVGTNGGITPVGLAFSAFGGAVVGMSYFLTLLASDNSVDVFPQAILSLLIGAASGFFGSVLDSFVGATLQYSGLDTRTGKVVESPGVGVRHISGRPFFDNHSVNLIMSILTSVTVPTIAGFLCTRLR